MEYTLNNTDIFNPNISDKIRQLIENQTIFDKCKYYRIVICFHVNLLEASNRMVEFFKEYVLNNSDQEEKEFNYKDIIHNVLGFILNDINDTLQDQINICNSCIKGCVLSSSDTIVIEILECNPTYLGKGKNKRVYPIRLVLPDTRIVDNISEKDEVRITLNLLLKENLITNDEHRKALSYLGKLK